MGPGPPPHPVLQPGTRLLGGFTTFSTASYEAVQLIRDRRWGLALTYGVGVLVAGVALALLGYASARRL